jgi:membrane-associated phospholipid phosphatase
MSVTTIRNNAWSWLPRGRRDFAFQTALWLSFVFGYQVLQAETGHDRVQALTNGLRVIGLEREFGHRLLELRVQELALDSTLLRASTTLVYRTSEFVVIALALLWVYLRRNSAFRQLRNTLIVTSLLALVAFYVFPTAPPRTFVTLGFVDTTRGSSGATSGHGFELLPSNQYAAMPSLHSADALIVGVGLALLVSSRMAKFAWVLWPVVVWFSVLATANHFWLDVVAGIALAGVGAVAVAVAPRALRPLASSATRPRPLVDDGAASTLEDAPQPRTSMHQP